MRESELKELLEAIAAGGIAPAEALERLRDLPFAEVGAFATLDHHRELRCGFPEVMLGEDKSAEQCRAIAAGLATKGGVMLATRLDPEKASAVLEAVPGAEYFPEARLVRRIPAGAFEGVVMSGPAAVVSGYGSYRQASLSATAGDQVAEHRGLVVQPPSSAQLAEDTERADDRRDVGGVGPAVRTAYRSHRPRVPSGGDLATAGESDPVDSKHYRDLLSARRRAKNAARQKRFEIGSKPGQARCGYPPESRSVIGVLSGNDLVSLRLASLQMVLPRHFNGRFIGLGTTVDKKAN